MKRFRVLTAALCAAVLLCGFSAPAYAYAGGGEGEDYGDPTMETPAPEPTITPGEGFSEEGNLVTRDLLYDEHTNKQFITVQTSGGNTFYIVIDYDKPVDEEGEQYETYFFSVVDEGDLLAAAEAAGVEQAVCSCPEKCAAGAVNTDCPVCSVNMGKYMQIEGLLDKVRSTGMGGISADDDRAVEKLEAKLAGLEAMQEEMKTVNAYYRKHKTLEGCPVLSAEEIGKLQSSMASDWRKNPVPYPSYLLTNNNANIRRTRQRIEDLKSQSEYAGWAFPGGRAEINEGENRLQLFFEEKPSEEQRRELKSNGFKWAPSQGAWQRQLTKNSIYAAGRMEFLRPEDGQSPYQLQPFARKTEKDMTR